MRLVEAGPRILSRYPEALSAKARHQLQRLGVEVLSGTGVSVINADGIALGDQRLPARTVIWADGVTASPRGRSQDTPLDRAGRVQVDADLSVTGHPEIFVAGDLAAIAQADGRPVPGVAPAAKHSGASITSVIRARLAGKPAPPPFAYNSQGNLATIGRMAAIVPMGRLQQPGGVGLLVWVGCAGGLGWLCTRGSRSASAAAWWLCSTDRAANGSYQRSARILLGDPTPDPTRPGTWSATDA